MQLRAAVARDTSAPQQSNAPDFSVNGEMAALLETDMTPFQILPKRGRAAGGCLKNEARSGEGAYSAGADLLFAAGDTQKDLAKVAGRAGVLVAREPARGRRNCEEARGGRGFRQALSACPS